MRSIGRIFGKSDGEDGGEAVGLALLSFDVVDRRDDLCVLSVASANPNGFDPAHPPRLLVTTRHGERRFAVVERDDGDDRVAEFLVPAADLEDSVFMLEAGDARVRLDAPATHGAPAGATVHDALMALQAQLLDQARRLSELRTEVRRERDRTALAEDELEAARTLFDQGLLQHRADLHEVRDRADRAETALEEARAEIRRESELREQVEAPLRAEIAEARAAADRESERAARAERELSEARQELSEQGAALERLREREQAARRDADEAREAARAEATSLRDDLDAERQGRQRAEERASVALGDAEQREKALDRIEQEREALRADLDRTREARDAERAERDELRRALDAERRARDDADDRATEAKHAAAARDAEIEEAWQRIASLEQSLADARGAVQADDGALQAQLDQERAAREKIAHALEAERAERAEIGARLAAAEDALAEARTARYRAEQEAAEARTGAGRNGGAPPSFDHDALGAGEVLPFLSPASLAGLDFDGLAEAYDIAADAWRTQARAGNDDEADGWRRIARQIVDEAGNREEASPSADAMRARRLPRRQSRLRAQLREACAERAGGN